MCINDACSFGRPSPLRGMGRLFISAPETQSTWNTKELSQHSQDKDDPGCMADLQSWHFKREIPFKCWWHNTTIRLQGGRKFPKVEKLQGLYLQKRCKTFVFTRAEVTSGLCDCGGEHLLILPRTAALVPRPGQQGALGAGLRRSSPSARGTLPSASLTSAALPHKSQDLGSG